MARSRTIKNTLDPNWCNVHTSDIDSRIDLSACSMRYEVWDWDYGGDDVDDLLGQITFHEAANEENEKKNDEKKNDEKKNDEKKNDDKNFVLSNLLEQCRDGKTYDDFIKDETVRRRKEDEERHERLLYKIDHPHDHHHDKPEENANEVNDNTNIYKEPPPFLISRKLSPLPKEKDEIKKPSKTIRIKGSLVVGARIEPSIASMKATKLLLEEERAAATAFELWPLLYEADMSNNRLVQLPRGVRGWKHLRRLYLGGNTLTVLPDEICLCSNLENLILIDNQLGKNKGKCQLLFF